MDIMLIYRVDIAFDNEARKYYVVRSEVPGLHAEAKSLEDLEVVLRDVVPELAESNRIPLFTTARAFLRGLRVRRPAHVGARSVGLRLSQDLCIAH